MSISQEVIKHALSQLIDPNTGVDPVTSNSVKQIEIQGGKVSVEIELNYAADLFKAGWQQMLQMQLEAVAGVEQALVTVKSVIPRFQASKENPALSSVKNIIAVASGKGGVGKSTTAANLALALAREGAQVGILDADIYGPSLGLMFGVPVNTRPEVQQQKFFVPIEAHGVKVMSMAFLTTDDTPMVWRGPMASGALLQLITQTAWGELDYLVVDMPPGTGDIQLTLAQQVPVAGAVIVTTPQDIALIDARKGIEMFSKVNIPVLGVVENMAMHVCSNCGQIEHLFGEGGGIKLAEVYKVDLLASLPLSMAIRLQGDNGQPLTGADPESQIAMVYQQLARRVGAEVARKEVKFPEISIG